RRGSPRHRPSARSRGTAGWPGSPPRRLPSGCRGSWILAAWPLCSLCVRRSVRGLRGLRGALVAQPAEVDLDRRAGEPAPVASREPDVGKAEGDGADLAAVGADEVGVRVLAAGLVAV